MAVSAGWDVGSRLVKVCLADQGRILGMAHAPLDRDLDRVLSGLFRQALGRAGIGRREVKSTGATGFGQQAVKKARARFSEGLAVVRGVREVLPGAGTVVDVGGLHIRVWTGDRGRGLDGVVNDACAAGSGKFLEMVAVALEMPMEEVAAFPGTEGSAFAVRTGCAVFAESEVITRVNEGGDPGEILDGVLASIADRTATLMEKAGGNGPVVLAGGMAGIPRFRERLGGLTGRKVRTLPMDPLFAGAYGAALLALENAGRRGILSRILGS